jgi:hypothetical protein
MLKNLFRKKPAVQDPEKELAEWLQNGKPVPPPHIVKQKAILEYRDRYHLNVLVETGTYLGDMVEAQKNNFASIYSIELSDKLYERALKRFSGQDKVHLLKGDSGLMLREVVSSLKRPALFWLDGHYSGGITALGEKECPVNEELQAIFKTDHPHVILIDDARMFNGKQGYPTIDEIKEIIEQYNKTYSTEVKDDIIRLTPVL